MGNFRQQDPSLFSHGLVSTDKFPNVLTLLNSASCFVLNNGLFHSQIGKEIITQDCSDIQLIRGSGDQVSRFPCPTPRAVESPSESSMQGNLFFLSDIAACVLLTQFI